MTLESQPTIDEMAEAAFRRGDEEAFGRISHRYFRELHIHCYRMIGSFDDAEDLVQETLLRAWHRRDSYEGRAPVRTWLYRIATNVCIDTIRARTTRGTADRDAGVPRYSCCPWLQPYPDALLDLVGGDSARPDARIARRQTIELALLAALQLLPAKQRAVFILRDVLDFSATETAGLLDDTTAAVNSALQRARTTLQKRRAPAPGTPVSGQATFTEAVLLQMFMAAQERGDVDTIVALFRDDVRMTLFPDGVTWDGRADVTCEFLRVKSTFDGDIRTVATAANRQPAFAVYLRRPNDATYRAWAVVLLGVREGKLQEVATFTSRQVFARFHLPQTLPER